MPAGGFIVELDPRLRDVLVLKDELTTRLRAFQENPEVHERARVMDVTGRLESALRWLQDDGAALPGSSFVSALVELALDRARREVDVDVYLRAPAAPVRRALDEALDALERLEGIEERLRGAPDNDETLGSLEAAVVALAGFRNEVVGMQQRTWRTAAVDHGLERLEDGLSRARALIRQATALRDPRTKRSTRETLRVLIQVGG